MAVDDFKGWLVKNDACGLIYVCSLKNYITCVIISSNLINQVCRTGGTFFFFEVQQIK